MTVKGRAFSSRINKTLCKIRKFNIWDQTGIMVSIWKQFTEDITEPEIKLNSPIKQLRSVIQYRIKKVIAKNIKNLVNI